MAESPDSKRMKMEINAESTAVELPTCQHFVKRKKRYCRLTPAKGEVFCGEHLPITKNPDADNANDKRSKARVPCPLNSKHTVCVRKLKKHLQVCNAIVKDCPDYIVTGLNAGTDDTEQQQQQQQQSDSLTDFKLTDIDKETIDAIVEKINKLYALHKIDEKIDELTASHPLLATELSNEEYGHETLRHLIQTSTILGYLDYFKLFDDHISYVEYGAGRGQVSYWLAKAITNYPNSNVLLIDRASVRYKKDNQLDESHAVQRIRADIADFDISKHSLIQSSKKIVGLGKHLCGAATDFAIQCSIHGNDVAEMSAKEPKTVAIIIALCCHHRCDWKHFVGKEFFRQNGISAKEFAIITKMVGWAICGTGMSRERRKEIEERKLAGNVQVLARAIEPDSPKRDRHERKEIGQRCKRLIDFARICYLEQHKYKCSLKRYVSSDITLENICLVAIHENQYNK